jgi:4-hydroxythreonine-4-phosphate dehydrogenase
MLPLPPTVGITMGDPAGIGPEVIAKALKSQQLGSICRPIVIGSCAVFQQVGGSHLPVLDVVKVDRRRIRPGRISAWSGRAAAKALQLGLQMALDGRLDALVTGPVSKQGLHLAGLRDPGQTEFLARGTMTKRFAMMLVAGSLRVVLATRHLPLTRVGSALTRGRVKTAVSLAHSAMIDLFGIHRPRVGVCALNPHAGEEGLFGRQENTIIGPAIRELRDRGMTIRGPLPADTLFSAIIRRQFDVIVAMYHDQGLIPVKMSGFGRAVNITLGLPIIRTSPDHGTAADIAGRGTANPESMIRAIRLATRLARARRKSSQQ